MEFTVRLWSKAYAPVADEDTFGVQVDQTLWEEMMEDQHTGRLFLCLPHDTPNQPDWIAPIGQPIPRPQRFAESDTPTEIPNIYLPLWMLDAGQFCGMGETILVKVLDKEAFPNATKLVLRVVDSAFYNSDVKAELEAALSSIGVIREHMTLQIPVKQLGDYHVEVFVSKTEPTNIVLCEGEEVVVEFEEPVDHYEPPVQPPRVATPPPPEPDFLMPEGAHPVISTGGISASSSSSGQGFVPFQGSGNRLGSSGSSGTVAPNPWRRV